MVYKRIKINNKSTLFSLKRRLSHKVGELLKIYYIKKYKNKLYIGKTVLFCHKTKIQIGESGVIHIDNNCMIYGTLISSCEGNISIGENTSIRMGTEIYAAKNVTIGKGVIISNNITISDNNNHPVHPEDRKKMVNSGWLSKYWSWEFSEKATITIEENVWIGQFVRINKGVKIAKNSVIGANSVVTKNVEENSIAAGNPAKIVKININKSSNRAIP